jgi:hypothetical protein
MIFAMAFAMGGGAFGFVANGICNGICNCRGSILESLQISFATADGLGWVSVLKRYKWYL